MIRVILTVAALGAMMAGALSLRAYREFSRQASWAILASAFGLAGVGLALLAMVGTGGYLGYVSAAVLLVAMFCGVGALVIITRAPGIHVTGEHALSHAALQDRERRFRRLVEHAWDAVVLVDRKGILLFASESIRQLLGYTAHELVGRPILDIVQEDQHSMVIERFQAVLDEPGARAIHEFRARHKDGTWRWLEVVGTNQLDDASVHAVVGNLRDVTERKEAEEALRRSEQSYRALVEHATHGIYRSDPGGRFLSVNPALVRMLGYSSGEELLALDVATDVYTDAAQRRNLVEQYRDASLIEGVEVEWRRRDGERILVWLTGSPIHNDEGELEAFEMIAEDVTERRTLEAQLRQAQKMEAIGQLTGGIAHDFNNLLTVVLANVDIIAATLPAGSEPLDEEIADVRRAAERGRDMVRKLLGYGRRDMLVVRPLNITSVVSGLVPTLRRVLPESIDIRFIPRLSEVVIKADSGALEQILFNLATNARDAMSEGGVIRIDLGRLNVDQHPLLREWGADGDFVRLAVTDTGHGMDEETRARVFDPFFTTKPADLGTGLGMAMIYGLVKQQSGFVDIQSVPGKGTTVELFFPIVAATPESTEGGGDSPAVGEGTETVLLVEDEAAIRRSVKRLLERVGYSVLLAEDGVEALDVFDRHRSAIDLVISDIVMPRMGGIELFETLRERGGTLPFLFTSGYATQDLKQIPRDVSHGFLAKPWDVDDLLKHVRDLLDAPAHQELHTSPEEELTNNEQ